MATSRFDSTAGSIDQMGEGRAEERRGQERRGAAGAPPPFFFWLPPPSVPLAFHRTTLTLHRRAQRTPFLPLPSAETKGLALIEPRGWPAGGEQPSRSPRFVGGREEWVLCGVRGGFSELGCTWKSGAGRCCRRRGGCPSSIFLILIFPSVLFARGDRTSSWFSYDGETIPRGSRAGGGGGDQNGWVCESFAGGPRFPSLSGHPCHSWCFVPRAGEEKKLFMCVCCLLLVADKRRSGGRVTCLGECDGRWTPPFL